MLNLVAFSFNNPINYNLPRLRPGVTSWAPAPTAPAARTPSAAGPVDQISHNGQKSSWSALHCNLHHKSIFTLTCCPNTNGGVWVYPPPNGFSSRWCQCHPAYPTPSSYPSRCGTRSPLRSSVPCGHLHRSPHQPDAWSPEQSKGTK